MTIKIASWFFPLIANGGLLLWALLWPSPAPQGGDYNFGPAFDALVRAIIVIILTLLIWLIYFATRFFFG